MNVTCGRCGTAYDFDDALLTSRGATVRCTRCQFEFRIRLPGAVNLERWIVRRSTGEEYEFESDAELQDAELRGALSRLDEVSRDGVTFVPIAHRGELMQWSSLPPPALRRRSRAPGGMPTPTPTPAPVAPMQMPMPAAQSPSAYPPNVQGQVRISAAPPGMPSGMAPPIVPGQPYIAAQAYNTAQPYITAQPFTVPPPSNTGTGSRWIVGFVLMGAGALLSATVGRDYLAGAQGTTKVVEPAPDNRTKEWVAHGEALLADGDLQAARSEFDRALGAAESDLGALLGVLRVELIQADAAWLIARFAGANANQAKAAQLELDAHVLRLQLAIKSLHDHTETLLPANLYLTDALRVQGQLQAARQMLTQVTQSPSDPEVAYVLAMLDFAEPEPSFAPVVDRLNVAAAAERIPGRATAALIYALSRAGRRAEAQQQLAALSRLEPRNLLNALNNYFVATEAPAPAESASSASRGTKHAAVDSTPMGGSYGETMTLAVNARGAHDYELAGRLYSHALSHNPSSVEAMVGLGDVAKLQGKLAIASSHYAAALRQNPKSDLALRALGDLRWETGERAAAVELYRTIPAAQRGARAAQRLAEWGAPESAPREAPEDRETP